MKSQGELIVRQTVTKVVRAPDVRAKIEELKAMLLAESDAWAESLNYAVMHELDGRLAYRCKIYLFRALERLPLESARPNADVIVAYMTYMVYNDALCQKLRTGRMIVDSAESVD